MDIAHKILNLDDRDYHMHTSTFSDALNTVDELVIHAGKIGLKEIVITDHSQICLDGFVKRAGFYRSGARWTLRSRRNVHNDVKVSFGVEGDLINETGDICIDIQGFEPDFCILSAHSDVYQGNPESVTDATIEAIRLHHKKIKFIGHPCNNGDFGQYYDIDKLVAVANEYKIPLEMNAKNLMWGKTNIEKLHILLQKADQIYLNSDAHTLYELQESRKFAINWLRENGYLA